MDFGSEIIRVSNDTNKCASEGCMKIALVTDTHLSNTGMETCRNIRSVDESVNFDCCVHMGDFLTGGIPENVSWQLLKQEINMYRISTKSNILYISQGNHDGYRNETFKGQLADNVVFDDVWYENTKFIDLYKNVVRNGISPYYYVDFPEKKIRLIFFVFKYIYV